MKDSNTIKRVMLPISFFGALIAVLLIGESIRPIAATMVVKNGEALRVPEVKQELPTCKENTDCPLPTTYCDGHYCTRLQNPTCDCSKPNVLRCYEKNGRARFTYCANVCEKTENGAFCQ